MKDIFSESFWKTRGRNMIPSIHDLAFYASWKGVFLSSLNHPSSQVREIGVAYDKNIVYGLDGETYLYQEEHSSQLTHIPDCREVFWINEGLYYTDNQERLYHFSPNGVILLHEGTWQLYQHKNQVWLIDNNNCLHKVSILEEDKYIRLLLSEPTKAADLYLPVVSKREELIRIADVYDPKTGTTYMWYNASRCGV